MRDLSATLKAAQQAESIDALVKIVLTHGEDSYTYDRDRIVDKNHPEEPYSQKAKLVLDNSDGALTALDLQGFKGVISYGAITSAGEEYSATAPLWVISQQFNSSPGALDCTLSLIGIMNLMAEDKASEKYMPDEEDTKTVKTLINQILGATLACYSHCTAFEVVWEDGYDSLADTYKPKDTFRIYGGGSRLASFRRALDYTGNVARVEADGKVHIFKPTISGVVYDSEYSLESGHTFFSKAYRKRVVIPGYIVVKSRENDDPQYSGYAKDPGYDDLPAELKKRDFKQMRLESDNQADDIAEAILSKHQLWSEMGAAVVPMNVGAEVFDYVKVGAFNSDDVYRIGNLGHLTRHYNAERAEWRMTFRFGSWLTVRKVLEGLGITSDELEGYFSRLMVKDLYVENILAENCDFVWIDPDNTIDLSKIGDTLDSLPDGEVYARVKTLHMDAGIIKLDENILYKAGYDPTGESAPEAPYRRALSAALTAAGLVILDQVVVGTYGLVKSTDISAGHILLSHCEGDLDDIDDGSRYEKVRGTQVSAGYLKLTSATRKSGEWYDETGVIIDASEGLFIDGLSLAFVDGSLSDIKGWIYGDDNFGFLVIAEDESLTLGASGSGANDLILAPDDEIIFKADSEPKYDSEYDMGADAKRFLNGYFDNLPASPVPTSNSALEVIKKIKAPKVMEDERYGTRHHFRDEDLPDEMKCEIMEKIKTKPVYRVEEFVNKRGKRAKRRVLVQAGKIERLPTGRKEPEYIRCIGVLIEANRELLERVEALEAK